MSDNYNHSNCVSMPGPPVTRTPSTDKAQPRFIPNVKPTKKGMKATSRGSSRR